jgi:hypothetical protein
MKIDSVEINSIAHIISQAKIIKKKRERAVYKNEDFFYKVWVPNWTQGDITKHALDVGFYCEDNASALVSLIYDSSGQRGYITKAGKLLAPMGGQGWSLFCNLTSTVQRVEFMKCLLDKGIESKGIFVDLVPSNMVLIDKKISLIDFDSFNSFSFMFDRQRQWYERFELDAWWKPFETANRDVDRFYRSYFNQCLGIEIQNKIQSTEDIKMLKNKLESLK